MLALPVVIERGGFEAVTQVKVAAPVSAFDFFCVFGIFFDLDVNHQAGLGVLFTDGFQDF